MPDITAPGRSCPLSYRYQPEVLARPPDFDCETLYAVGGLYGNEQALTAAVEMFEGEGGVKRLVFNGDFNWFNVDPMSFEGINGVVLDHTALRGNVETELAADGDDGGCG